MSEERKTFQVEQRVVCVESHHPSFGRTGTVSAVYDRGANGYVEVALDPADRTATRFPNPRCQFAPEWLQPINSTELPPPLPSIRNLQSFLNEYSNHVSTYSVPWDELLRMWESCKAVVHSSTSSIETQEERERRAQGYFTQEMQRYIVVRLSQELDHLAQVNLDAQKG